MALIEIENLSYWYPGSEEPVLRNISLSIEKGEFVILTGPTGCGKSTFCRCLNGLIPHFYGGKLEGTVKVAGFSVAETSTSTLSQHVGFVFQNPENQLFTFSVEREIVYGPENLGLPEHEIQKRLEWILRLMGLSKLRNRIPYELSGGQQQRVAIASVLAMKPEILILDEPTSSLDPLGVKAILEVIKRLNEELRITILFVEHRLDLVAPYADRMLIMKEGRIAFDGAPEKILSEEKVVETGIAIPKLIMLHRMLQAKGISLPGRPLLVEEEAKLIRKVLYT